MDIPLHLASLSGSLVDAIGKHGAVAVFLLMAVDALLPIGGELIMLYAGVLAAGAVVGADVSVLGLHPSTGLPSFLVMVAAGTLGTLVGALAGWGLGARGGHPFVERYGRWLHLGPSRMARAQRRSAGSPATLDTTALVHEVYLKLHDSAERRGIDRAHFLSLAVRAMRQVLVDHARSRGRLKRGGDCAITGLHAEAGATGSAIDLVELDAALTELARIDPLGRERNGLAFQQHADPPQLQESFDAEHRERDLAAGAHFQRALRHQPPHGVAHRHHAGAERVGDGAQGEHSAGLEAALHDGVLQFKVDAIVEGLALHRRESRDDICLDVASRHACFTPSVCLGPPAAGHAGTPESDY